jgi:hypothetical protein
LSPGTVLLHLVIEDVINNQGVTLVNMGYGDPGHELRSTNVVLDYCSYWLLPNTLANRCFRAWHVALRRALAAIKRHAPRAARQSALTADPAPLEQEPTSREPGCDGPRVQA